MVAIFSKAYLKIIGGIESQNEFFEGVIDLFEKIKAGMTDKELSKELRIIIEKEKGYL